MSNLLKPNVETFSDKSKKKIYRILWLFALSPFIFILCLLMFQSEDNLPPVSFLDNPPELLASMVYADDSKTELGRYWKINRKSVSYKEITPFLTDALISTEDERFVEHSGVDAKALGRAIVNVGGNGGASTITQQLAKLLFTLQDRDRDAMAKITNEKVAPSSGFGRKFTRLGEKARENIIATRLERKYTKEEIITMYFNQFDFLFNAVGIHSAAKVYYNKSPKNLSKDEAAMLVGMCKNPALFNPYLFKVKNYRATIAANKGITLKQVSVADIKAAKLADSTRAINRRNQVLQNWLKNSNEKNEAIRIPITEAEYKTLSALPLKTDYQIVDHKTGEAPYFREQLRKELQRLLTSLNANGELTYKREDGKNWDLYSDGLKIYTSINYEMQKHGEKALKDHLRETLQPSFDNNNAGLKNKPFSNDLSKEEVEAIERRAIRISDRYKNMIENGATKEEIETSFYKKKYPMLVFDWKKENDNYERKVVWSPIDSIRYYKGFLQAGLVSIEPQTGFIKAWVGGANISHFAFDHVGLGTRQVGSTMKPFVYAAAIEMGVIRPCTQIPNIRYCLDLYNASGNVDNKWCPDNSSGGIGGGSKTVSNGLQNSLNNITVGIMVKMGSRSGPPLIAKLLANMGIPLAPDQIVPSMCLGSVDMSLLQMTAAQCIFANQGIYNKPTAILRIEDRNGNVIYSAKPTSREVLSPNTAFATVEMMKRVVSSGTAGRLRQYVTSPVAGKTGTTQNNSDGWFIGLTANLVTGVWVGAEDRSVRFRSTDQGQGARVALPIWGMFYRELFKDPKIALSDEDFDAPESYRESEYWNCSGNESGVRQSGDGVSDSDNSEIPGI